MFLTLSKFTLNTDTVVYMNEIKSREFRKCPLDLYPIERMRDFGFKVDYPDEYMITPNWEIANEQADSSERLVMPSNKDRAPGYYALRHGKHLELIERYVEKGYMKEDPNNLCFLPLEKWNDTYAYEVHLLNGENVFITVEDYRLFSRMLLETIAVI